MNSARNVFRTYSEGYDFLGQSCPEHDPSIVVTLGKLHMRVVSTEHSVHKVWFLGAVLMRVPASTKSIGLLYSTLLPYCRALLLQLKSSPLEPKCQLRFTENNTTLYAQEATDPNFAVGEYWDSLTYSGSTMDYNQDSHRQRIINWINAAGGLAGAFDVTTKGILHTTFENCE